MENSKLKIILIDDHVLLTQSLEKLLSKYDFIGEIILFKSAEEFLSQAETLSPDVVISDILMTGKSGIDLLIEYKKIRKDCKFIFLTSIVEVQTIRHAMRNGASGYLSKDTSPDELADCILAVHSGDSYIGENLRNALIRNSFAEDRFVYNLSPREKELLNQVCSGKTIKEAAYDMGLSVNTVQTYYKSVLKKFNLNRTADLIVFAIQNGLYNPQK